MGLDGAGEDLELEVAVSVNRQDSRDSWVGVFVADYDVSTNDRIEARTGIGSANPETAVVGHVHEVDGDVVGLGHGATSFHDVRLPLGCPAGVGDRFVEAPVEPGNRELAEVWQHQGEVRVIEGARSANPPVRTRPKVERRTRR